MTLNIDLIKSIFKTSRTRGKGLGGDIKQKIIKEPQREIFIHGTRAYDAAVGGFGIDNLSSTGFQNFNIKMPTDFISILEAAIFIIPDATETIQWDIRSDVAKLGGDQGTAGVTINNETQAVTLGVLTELDIKAIFVGVKANDYVGIKFSSDTTNIGLAALRILFE